MITLSDLNIIGSNIIYNSNPEYLYNQTLIKKMGVLTSKDVLAVNTGKFTGRSPKDRYIVKDNITKSRVWWGDINKPLSNEFFDGLYDKVSRYLSGKDLYVRDSSACALEKSRIKVRSVCELPWNDLFIHNMFIREYSEEKDVDWNILCAPKFEADPNLDGVENKNFTIINFSRKIILIAGSSYTGEIKKSIFSALNFTLPVNENILPMHCSANIGKDGKTSIFFGLSGTGKTTLSTDKSRKLIGDDEHGWCPDNAVFNFEGGCYAKVLNLSKSKEPDIFKAIKPSALLENVVIDENKNVVFSDNSISQNSRVSYPIYHINNSVTPSIGNKPKNIFFLTADAFGVLPAVSKLSKFQAAYHFISGYTSKLAGTEEGINDPVPNFSACFGAPFMPLHPSEYAEMLISKIESCKSDVWLINTGWIGGPFGVGKRIELKYTRKIIDSINSGELDMLNSGKYRTHSIFNFKIPIICPDIPDHILSQKQLWEDDRKLWIALQNLSDHFKKNFKKFESEVPDKIKLGGPN